MFKFRENAVPDSFTSLFLGAVFPREFSNATGPTGRRVDIMNAFAHQQIIFKMNISRAKPGFESRDTVVRK